METILDKLEQLPIHKRTTYKKSAELNDETQIILDSAPSILGNGFLFQNRTVSRVRDRLNRIEYRSDEEREQQDTKSIQTESVADLYAGAEELEKGEMTTKPMNVKSVPALEERTQILTDAPSMAATEDEERLIGLAKRRESIQETTVLSPTQKVEEIKETPHTDRGLEPFQSTQLDASRSLLFQATMPDKPKPAPTLKIHDLQKELEDDGLKKELKKNVAFKKSYRLAHTKQKFSKESFLERFDEGSSSDDEAVEITRKDFNTEQSETWRNFSDDFKKSTQKHTMFRVYEHKLKLELDARRRISLDDDDESERSAYLFSSRASKATVLDIKARKSKQEPLGKTKQRRSTANDLIYSLKKASRKQISNYQRELMECKGYKLEDIEKEKEEVENLLEQEIARNKRIAQRERREAKIQDSDEESYRSANESADAEISDEDGDKLLSCSENEGDTNLLNNENQNMSQDQSNERTEGDRDDEGDFIQKGRTKCHKTLIVEDVDSDEEHPSSRNVIDLGPYGNNLEPNQMDVVGANDSPLKTTQFEASKEEKERELMIHKIRQREKIQRKKEQRFKEMRAQGFGKMLEMEAEESDDEWHGIGGKDEELSEDYDSDLEGMIDDFTRSNESFDNIRQLLAKEDKELDEKLVNKILYDIKNGGFRKRGRNPLELDLSDAEDEGLRAYRLKRKELIRKSRLGNKENEKTFKNLKSKAFLDSMVEDIDEVKNPFGEAELGEENGTELEMQEAETGAETRNHTISQEFVQQTLSFLNNSRSSQEFEMEDHIVKADMEHDVSSLKRNSSIHMLHDSSTLSKIDAKAGTHDDEFIAALPNFMPPSLVKSFTLGADPNNKFHSGKKTVTVSKSYRAVGGNRSSITYFGKIRKLVAPKKNIRPMSKVKNSSKSHMVKLLESQENRFET